MRSELEKQLRLDEGIRTHVYKDSRGYWTLGVGRLVDKTVPGSPGLRPVEINFLLQNDIEDRINALQRELAWFRQLDGARQGCLLNMSFQMGVDGLLEFHKTLELVRNFDYELAAHNMLQSLWAQQTPARAKRMSEQMRTGKWQYAEGA